MMNANQQKIFIEVVEFATSCTDKKANIDALYREIEKHDRTDSIYVVNELEKNGYLKKIDTSTFLVTDLAFKFKEKGYFEGILKEEEKQKNRIQKEEEKFDFDYGISKWNFNFRKFNLLTFAISITTVAYLIYDHLPSRHKGELEYSKQIARQVIKSLAKTAPEIEHTSKMKGK